MPTDPLAGGAAAERRGGLLPAWAVGGPGSGTPHTVVLLPSYSVADSLLRHYADRLLLLEHRHLLHVLALDRLPGARLVFVTSSRPAPEVVDYYLALLPPRRRRDVRARLRFLEVPGPHPRSVSSKLLERPDLVTRLGRMVGGSPAFIDPWNVTEDEARLARLLGLPLNGTPAELWPLGFKSSGRKLMRAAGVPVPRGREDLRSVDDVADAVLAVARSEPAAPVGVVVKTDNSGAGDGNRILPLDGVPSAAQVRSAVAAWEPWYRDELSRGAVVEELVAGPRTTFPSVQVQIAPSGEVEVVSTHEQLVGGPSGHVYQGCRLPADPAYAARLATYGAAVGRSLAQQGALGRLSVDFAAVERAPGAWQLYGLEVNLRKTGTTHPLVALASLVPGRYHPALGRWRADDGSERCYRSTDNLVVPALRGAGAGVAATAVRRAGLQFDRRTGSGVVLHGFCGLSIDGRIGLTAIGTSPDHADRWYRQAASVLGAPESDAPGRSADPARGAPLIRGG